MKTAHYFASKSVKYVVFGVDGKTMPHAKKHDVAGKVAARRLAKTEKACPWNF